MPRVKGTFSFSANYEVAIKAPLDARLATTLKSDLTGLPFAYKGMVVAVTDDPTSTNNGLYYLVNDTSPLDISYWVKISDSVQAAITLTTTGNSGSATLTGSALNIPAYTLAGLGGVPLTRNLTINGTTVDLSTDRSWIVGDVRTDSSYSNPAWLTSLAWSKITGAPAFLTSFTETDPIWIADKPYYATQSYVNTQITNLINSAPATLDTLNELAIALGNDPNFATTVATALGNRLRVDINNQGLDSTQRANGRTNLGLGDLATLSVIGNAYITDLAWSKITGAPSFLTSFTETDPTVGSHIKAITGTQISNWDTAFSWGNHAAVGYLTSFTETDPTVPAHVKAITTTNISNWNTAFGWGNHAAVGYLTSFTESDPTVPSHVKAITTTNISNWNAAYSWGNHATMGYLTSFTESDPTVPGHVKGITTTNISNWNAAYGWGNHATAGYLTSYTETDTLHSVTTRGNTTTNSVGIGTNSPDGAYKLHVVGNTLITGTITATAGGFNSDINDKTYVTAKLPLGIGDLVGKSYLRISTQEREYGYIAQEVEPILPEAVYKTTKGLAVSYHMVNAARIDYLYSYTDLLEDEIKVLRARVNALEDHIKTLGGH